MQAVSANDLILEIDTDGSSLHHLGDIRRSTLGFFGIGTLEIDRERQIG